jgi:integrase
MNNLVKLHGAFLRGRGYSTRTIQAAMDCLDRIDRFCALGITRTSRMELESYFANEAWAAQTREVYFHHARKFFEWGTDEDVDLLESNPMARMARPLKGKRGVPRPLSAREVDVIVHAAVDPWRLAAVAALEAGLRCCEIAELRKEDVMADEVFVIGAKGGGLASVPGRAPLLLELVRDLPEGNVMESVGGRADPQWLSTRAAYYFQHTLGLSGVTMHRCRHTYARRLRDAGCDAFVIKRKMRHSSLTSTQIYVGASDDECRQAVQGLAPLSQIPVAC